MTDEEKVPEPKGQGPGEVVRGWVERIGETIDATAKIAKLNLDIGALNSQRTVVFQDMGRKVYDLYGKGLVKNAGLAAMSADVAQIDAQIAEKRAQIAELRGQRARAEEHEDVEEMGVEEETAAPTSSGDLSTDEEQQARPPEGDRKL